MAGSILQKGLQTAQGLSGQMPSVVSFNPNLGNGLGSYFKIPEAPPIDNRPTWDHLDILQYERARDRERYENIINNQREIMDNYENRLDQFNRNLTNQQPIPNTIPQVKSSSWTGVQGGINKGHTIAEDHNNPLNEKIPGSTQAGRGAFKVYKTLDDGIRGNYGLLQRYQTKHGLNTVQGIISRWAPSSDGNNTKAYIDFVSKHSGFAPNQQINVMDIPTAAKLIKAMAIRESSRLGNKLTLDQIQSALLN